MIIAISAGHYPERPGACFDDFCEHGEAKIWAILITNELIREGVDARMVPTGTLKSKTKWINDIKATLAIEIHFNSAVDADGKHVGRGCECLYHPESERGAYLANELLNAIDGLFAPSRGIKEGYYRMDKTKGVDFFLRKTNCPSAILEPEFIHHTDRITLNRESACVSIAQSIKNIKV